MLKEQRIAAIRGIEDRQAEIALRRDQDERDRENGRRQNENEADGIQGPDEQGQPEPGHALGTQHVNGCDKVDAGGDGREAREKNSRGGGEHRPIREHGRIGRVKGPARVDAARYEDVNYEKAADQVQVPADEIEARECQVFRADHERYQEIAEDRGDGRNQEKPNHHHAMQREQPVIGFVAHNIRLRCHEFQPDHSHGGAADEKEERDRNRVENGDALVIRGREPRPEARRVQIRVRRRCNG